jgi:hypothetical protein
MSATLVRSSAPSDSQKEGKNKYVYLIRPYRQTCYTYVCINANESYIKPVAQQVGEEKGTGRIDTYVGGEGTGKENGKKRTGRREIREFT